MKIVTVIPLKKGLWKEDLTYFTAQNDISNGSIVSVPLRNKKTLGLVVSVEDAAPEKSSIKALSFNLKKISEIKGPSIFLKEYLDGAIEMSRYNVESKNNGITSLIPFPFRENYNKIAKIFAARNPVLGEKNQNNESRSFIKSEKLLFQAPLEDRISVYKTLIRGSFALKKSVFIVLPTEYDIKIFEESLSKGIEQFTLAIHGKLSPKKTIKKFEQITDIAHPILILGTTPFLSIPRNDIETIIVEHESSGAYKMIGKPHFDLRFFAELFASKINAKFILGDTLLRYESIARVDLDGFIPLHPMQFRINFEGQIKINNPNKKTEFGESFSLSKNDKKSYVFKILSEENVEEIKNTINKKKNVFVFALRKGLATQTICRDCSEIISCEKCGTPLVLYSSHLGKKRMFVCNRCERDVDGETVCASCGSWNLIPLGIGTDTVYEYVKEIFPKVKIFKLDKDSVKNAKEAEKIIREFSAQGGSASGGEGSILVGTEMAFFYFKNKISLSIIASFDSLWNIPNFKMSEKIIQIILSMLGNTNEKLIIQTKNENDSIISAIKSENLLSFIREELEDRKKLNYPPYKRFIKIKYLGDKTETLKIKQSLRNIFQEYNPEIFSGFIARQKGKYVTNALIKIEPKKWSLPGISLGASLDENLFAKLSFLPPSFEIFVDPEDLL